jgi:DNA mismatch repair protein MutL
MGRIHLLEDGLINQIAAGEVVERPASVVKELAENALDAQATSIRVRLSEGGLGAISILDDGFGMSRQDAELSLARHATSKLLDAEGLFQIVTKGFRGEAIPSIASVSRFTLTTSEPGALVGTRLTLTGGAGLTIEDAPAPGGTRIDVDELFFNVPARRKFLKRESTELGHCEEALVRLALAHPEVGFFLEHGGRTLISSPATPELRERIGALLGTEVLPHLLPIEERRLGVAVHGFIASPEFTLPTARALYAFVNRRYVRDRGVNSAVQRAYQDSLPPGRQPVAVIFIEVDPKAVDVNVHPQKLEVRFADPRSIQEALSSAIGRALKAAPWRQNPGAPLDGDVNAHYAMAVDRFLSRAAQNTGAFLESAPAPSLADAPRASFGTARPTLNEAPPQGYFASLRFIGELGRRFWLTEGPGGTLVIVDPLAARERLTLDRLVERLRAGALEAAPASLFSATLELPGLAAGVTAHRAAFARLGLGLEAFGGDTVAVRTLPAELEHATQALPALLEELAGIFSADPIGQVSEASLLKGLEAVAFRAVSTAFRSVSHEEALATLAALDGADFSRPARRGLVVLREVPLFELEARAQR